MARERVGIERTILCATRFWSMTRARGATTPTLTKGVRSVVRKQGFKPEQIDRALRKLESGGFIKTGGARSAKTIALTEKGGRVGCSTVKLAPWTNDEYPGSKLRGLGCGCGG
jgi:hypothetical protein